jgi:hypothetical protein
VALGDLQASEFRLHQPIKLSFDGALFHAERSRKRDHVAIVSLTGEVNQDAFFVSKVSHFSCS